MPDLDANHKKEDADAASMIGQNCRPSRMIVEFRDPGHRARTESGRLGAKV
jgi:hypothetical protein